MQWIVVALLCVVRTAEVDLLVDGLHAPDFQAREAAAAKIERLGRWAVPALERGLQHQDPEVRQRCARLLELGRRSDLEVRLAAFLEDLNSPEAGRLPGWERFRARYGDDNEARSLFVAMTHAFPDLGLALHINDQSILDRVVKTLRFAVPSEHLELVAVFMFLAVEQTDPYVGAGTFLETLCRLKGTHSRAFRQLATDFFCRHSTVFNLWIRVNLAERLYLDELTERDLKPELRRRVGELATRPPDAWAFWENLIFCEQLGLDDLRESLITSELPRLLQPRPVRSEERDRIWQILYFPEVGVRPEAQAYALDILRSRNKYASPTDRVDALNFFFKFGRRDVADEAAALLSDNAGAYGASVQVFAANFLLWRHGLKDGRGNFYFPHDDVVQSWRQYQANRLISTLVYAVVMRADPQGAALLRQLGSDSWTEREQAVKRLRQLGPQAAPLLRAGLEAADPEVAARCRRLLAP